MTKSQTYCDECGKPKGDESGWRRIGIDFEVRPPDKVRAVVIGKLSLDDRIDEIHDVCGENCFHRHIDKLLQPAIVTSPTIPSNTAPPITNSASDSPRD